MVVSAFDFVLEDGKLHKIDFHIARTFLVPFVIITAAALGLYIVADAMGDLDDFLAASDSFSQLISRMSEAYIARVPVFLTPLVPMTLLISGAFAIAYMARNNEITALKASGISVHRILMPVFVSATLVSLLAFANQEFVVPVVELHYLPQMRLWKGEKEQWIWLTRNMTKENTVCYVRYNVVKRAMLNPKLTIKHGREVAVIDGASGRWDSRENAWVLNDVTIDVAGMKVTKADSYVWKTSLTPRDLDADMLPASSQPLRAIMQGIGSEAHSVKYRVMVYSRLAYPLVGVALLLTGVPFMLQHESVRRSRLFGAGVCILIGAVYYLVNFVATALGEGGALPSAVAGLLPVLLFGALGVYLTDRIRT